MNSPRLREAQLALAIQCAAEAHIDQVDKGGEAYILHCLAVMHKVKPDRNAMMAAVLHDVQEDCEHYEIPFYSFPAEVRGTVNCLTRQKGETYHDYIERVAAHPTARKVKLADLEHNMEVGRLPMGDIGERDFQRWDKYRRALIRLKQEG